VIEQGLFGAAGHPKYEEYAHDIHIAGRQLHAKVDDILEFANLDAGRQPVRLVEVDSIEVARHALEEIAGRAFSRQIRTSLIVPEKASALADAQGLKRALSNLLYNALQFTKDGGTVRLQIRAEENAILIAIQDNGLGFSAVEAECATEPFARFDRPGRSTGTGLGLAVASSLVRRMGGSLTISGKKGEGAVAEIRLRRA